MGGESSKESHGADLPGAKHLFSPKETGFGEPQETKQKCLSVIPDKKSNLREEIEKLTGKEAGKTTVTQSTTGSELTRNHRKLHPTERYLNTDKKPREPSSAGNPSEPVTTTSAENQNTSPTRMQVNDSHEPSVMDRELSAPSSAAFGLQDVIKSDGQAAMACLLIMKRDYGKNCSSWPSKSSKVSAFVERQTQGRNCLADWIRRGMQNGEFKKPGMVRKRLMKELVQLNVARVVNGKITWYPRNIDRLLAVDTVAGSESLNHGRAVEGMQQRGASGQGMSEIAGVYFIDTVEQMSTLGNLVPFNTTSMNDSTECEVVAVDCEGVPEDLFLIQVGTRIETFVFDCVKLGAKKVCDFLKELFVDGRVLKLFHDIHNDAAALSTIGGITEMKGSLDTQLAMECLTGDVFFGLNQVLQELGKPQHTGKHIMKQQMKNKDLFSQRPLPRDVLQYAVDGVKLLFGTYEKLHERLGNHWEAIQRASDMRARTATAGGGTRSICFDVPNSYAFASYELLAMLRPNDMMAPLPLKVSNETDTLLKMISEDLTDALLENTHKLSEIVLDKGRRPHAWIGGKRILLGDDNRFVEQEEINAIVDRLGGFGSDNRAGLERQLHRISAIRNRESDIIGLTLRFGRHVSGNAGIISDLLFGDPTKSVLFLGDPGAGKTTVVREVTRLLAERCNVCIVDTSNEIAGDGDIPHPCVGFARRMMVPSLDHQSAVMIECVQNHTPEVMVIDEIGRPTEVEAARTCKNRGVRLIASAYGDLRKLIKNPKLRGLVGGVETVTLGDMQAKAEAKKQGGAIQKTKAERAGPPTFDIIVELKRGAHDEWRVVMDAGDAVDRILRGEEYKAQRRVRDAETGAVHLALDSA